ncbi:MULTISPECIES: SDR family NAD(P)-dependent oxidoreductase [Variovorax]|uniref:NAD(P)-dependent oxidoreductase n=1 Tax=Variovorax boronicumulans TaxID=436515 RepID=A0A1E7TT08_9BURK|nr:MULTISPECIES: SDR family oxidoreductase [Variovorax]ATA53608.1 NAD(P)-dependent oxidoreductase [Variovorax boronicumulans]OEZ26954.1 3-oxoacyl-ACP reductase [Variovorax boronicumulans]TSD60530.1 SDR family oxidoreductase [Variovorax sp. KBS0712]GER11453.1 NAD(P)-dependent oxidoreductase [Variovorax boronicumulans]GER15032.1 NAD(P)-dependent oxidoreductase [Variovorax boronicumulans]
MTQRLKDKVAIVVGAGSIGTDISNGAACAVTFAREGATVICVDRSPEAAATSVRRIHDIGGIAEAFEADVRSSEQIERMVNHCLARFGRIDVLHHNVGIEEFGELIEVTEESWDRVHAINLKGPMLTARAVVPHMIRQGGGAIINVSSIASRKWSPMQFLSYSTSKAALNHMTRVVARQYAQHQVRCNVIVPGLIDTPHAAALFKSEQEAQAGRQARNARCPMGRQGSAWDVANAALFLASDESSYVTGLELVVDGGLSL